MVHFLCEEFAYPDFEITPSTVIKGELQLFTGS